MADLEAANNKSKTIPEKMAEICEKIEKTT